MKTHMKPNGNNNNSNNNKNNNRRLEYIGKMPYILFIGGVVVIFMQL